MGDLSVDTELESTGEGSFVGEVVADWDIWTPNGGYVLAFALRAAGRSTSFARPASLHAHLVGAPKHGRIEIEVESLRAGRRSESLRVSTHQDGRRISEVMVWAVDDSEGLEVDFTEPPEAPRPDELPTAEERMADMPPQEGRPDMPFWDNLVNRPVNWISPHAWENERPVEPLLHGWYEFTPTSAFDDPFVDACRGLILLDICGWPAVHRGSDPAEDGKWIAPNMDQSVLFHQHGGDAPVLQLHGKAPLATAGLVGATGTVWAEDGRLLASGQQTMLCRPTR